MSKTKKGAAQEMAKAAEKAMRGRFGSFVKSIGECAGRGESSAEFSKFGFTDGQVETLRKMFGREGFAFEDGGKVFKVRW